MVPHLAMLTWYFCCQVLFLLPWCCVPLVAMELQVALILHVAMVIYVAMAPHLLQAYTPTNVSHSIDVWAFGIIATKVFLGRNLDKLRTVLWTVDSVLSLYIIHIWMQTLTLCNMHHFHPQTHTSPPLTPVRPLHPFSPKHTYLSFCTHRMHL